MNPLLSTTPSHLHAGHPQPVLPNANHSSYQRFSTTYLCRSTSLLPSHHNGDHHLPRFGNCMSLPLTPCRSTSDPRCTDATNLASVGRLLAILPTIRPRPSSPKRSWSPLVGRLLPREPLPPRPSLRVKVCRLCVSLYWSRPSPSP